MDTNSDIQAMRAVTPVRAVARPTPDAGAITPPAALPPPRTAVDLYAPDGLWPRAMRDTLLASTDYVDLPGYRKGKSVNRLAWEDAWRQRLRDLPKTVPATDAAVSALLAWFDIDDGAPA